MAKSPSTQQPKESGLAPARHSRTEASHSPIPPTWGRFAQWHGRKRETLQSRTIAIDGTYFGHPDFGDAQDAECPISKTRSEAIQLHTGAIRTGPLQRTTHGLLRSFRPLCSPPLLGGGDDCPPARRRELPFWLQRFRG